MDRVGRCHLHPAIKSNILSNGINQLQVSLDGGGGTELDTLSGLGITKKYNPNLLNGKHQKKPS